MVETAERQAWKTLALREALLARAYLYDDAAAYTAGVDAALAAVDGALSPQGPVFVDTAAS